MLASRSASDTSPPRRRHTLRRDTAGAAILEFGLIAIPFIALLVASLEVGIVYLAQATLQTVAERAARTVMTGVSQKAGQDAAAFKTAACANLPPYLACSKLAFDVRRASAFASVSTARPTLTYDASGNVTGGTTFQPGGAGEIVIVRAFYSWPVTVGPLGWDLSDVATARHLLVATSVSKTEPYRI